MQQSNSLSMNTQNLLFLSILILGFSWSQGEERDWYSVF